MPEEGKKFDTGKLRYDLVPVECIEEATKIITFGANKYWDNNWRLLENFEDRYYAAMMRHLLEWRKWNKIDDESWENHLSHVLANVMFLLSRDLENNKKEVDSKI